MTYNKDDQGFTDEAIRAVEQELTTLAEKIGVTEMELGERIADETHRKTYDFIETELITMRCVAMDILHERMKRRAAQIGGSKDMRARLEGLAYICAGIGLLFSVFGVGQGMPMNYLVPTLVYSVLFMALLLATMNTRAIERWLGRELTIDLNLSSELIDSSKEMIEDARAVVKETEQ